MPGSPHEDLDFVRDADPRALEVYFEIQRRRLPGQKLKDAFDLSEGPFDAVQAGIRLRHPAASAREVFPRAFATRLSRELMIHAYGWDPGLHE